MMVCVNITILVVHLMDPMQNVGSGVICGINYRAGNAIDAFGFVFYVSMGIKGRRFGGQ